MTTKKLPVAKDSKAEEFIFNSVNVRIIIKENEPLFCLADVCKILELSDTSNVTRQIKEEFGCPVLNTGHIVDNLGRTQQATFITEPQLYFVLMRSRSEKAWPFRQWVVNDVLPNIRKHGKYEIDEQKAIQEDTAQIKNLMINQLLSLRQEIDEMKSIKEELFVTTKKQKAVLEAQRYVLAEIRDLAAINHLKKAEEFLEKFAKDKDEKKITDFGKTAAEIIAEIKNKE